MKRKLLAALATCVAFTLSAGIFPACTDEDSRTDSTAPIQVTEAEWNKTISDFKKFGGLKNYTNEVSSTLRINGEEQVANGIWQIDMENARIYAPEFEVTSGEITIYLEIGDGFEMQDYGYTVCDFRRIGYSNGGYNLFEIDALDYDDAQLLFGIISGTLLLQEIKTDNDVIALEDAYDMFSYNEESGAYTATGMLLYTVAINNFPGNSSTDGKYVKLNYAKVYMNCNIEIIFNANYFILNIDSNNFYSETESLQAGFQDMHCTLSVKMCNYNMTEIILDEEIEDLLK